MPREMNEIEKQFWDSHYCKLARGALKPQVQIGPYLVDFVFMDEIIVEIDGHEAHKTKEQRAYDYKRERYLLKEGYTVARFMGTEVFLNADECGREMIRVYDARLTRHREDSDRGWREAVDKDKE